MDDVWFGHGASPSDLEACLRALALEGRQRPPLLAVATDEDEPRLLLASRALFALFDVASGEALAERLLGGRDPGARRLGILCRSLVLDGAPRLERLRFVMRAGTEIITFLCRRVPTGGGSRFIAAALGVRPMAMPEAMRTSTTATSEALPVMPMPTEKTLPLRALDAPRPPAPHRVHPMNIQAIHASLRTHWPASRTVRFTWQSDARMICTQATDALADIVGATNGRLLGRDLTALAPQIDASGRLADALQRKETWSGLDIDWPIDETPAAVRVGLGAIPAFDRDRSFEGYRGYGVIHLDRVVPAAPRRLDTPEPGKGIDAEDDIAGNIERTGGPSREVPPANVVQFPGPSKTLSPEDEEAFATLGAELREETGLDEHGLHPPEPQPAPDVPAETVPLAQDSADPRPSADRRAEEIARHGLAVIDRLALGILVSRDNIPIFANRHLLESLGFADEDELHEAGGMTHLFGGQSGNVTGAEAVGVRASDGRIVPANARMQTIEWDGLPATLLTLQPAGQAPAPASFQEAAFAPAVGTATSETSPPAGRDAAETRELRAILETATDGVAVIGGDCTILSLNRSGEALFGCDRGEVLGKPFLSLFAPHNQGLAADYLDGMKGKGPKSLLNDGRELLVSTRRGDTIPVFMTVGRLTSDDHDGGARFCALFRDLTHWKKVERELETAKQEAERANDLKSDFLAKVSHEVRTPLNAIIGFAEVMMEERFGPVGTERYKDYLRDIHASGTHVMSLVNDLLDLSKIEAGKMQLAIDAVDANKIIGECVAIMQPQASRERVIMRLSLAPSLPHIRADARSLRQIVLNLLSNAVKFNEPGGQVIVATAPTESGQVLIRIRDTGPGMSDADIAAALEPFRQLSTARPNTGGTGLGLPLTKALVEANQASFTIRSKVQQGTLVEVSFPPARVPA